MNGPCNGTGADPFSNILFPYEWYFPPRQCFTHIDDALLCQHVAFDSFVPREWYFADSMYTASPPATAIATACPTASERGVAFFQSVN